MIYNMMVSLIKPMIFTILLSSRPAAPLPPLSMLLFASYFQCVYSPARNLNYTFTRCPVPVFAFKHMHSNSHVKYVLMCKHPGSSIWLWTLVRPQPCRWEHPWTPDICVPLTKRSPHTGQRHSQDRKEPATAIIYTHTQWWMQLQYW